MLEWAQEPQTLGWDSNNFELHLQLFIPHNWRSIVDGLLCSSSQELPCVQSLSLSKFVMIWCTWKDTSAPNTYSPSLNPQAAYLRRLDDCHFPWPEPPSKRGPNRQPSRAPTAHHELKGSVCIVSLLRRVQTPQRRQHGVSTPPLHSGGTQHLAKRHCSSGPWFYIKF